MTNSAFVLDLSRPVPLHEFLLPAADMIIPSYRACVENPALSSKRHRIVRQPNATANEEFFSSANLLNQRLAPSLTLPYPDTDFYPSLSHDRLKLLMLLLCFNISLPLS